MTEPLYAATRKGLLTFREENAGWQLADTRFLGDPVSAFLADPRDGALYAALNLGHFGCKLHRSDDGGKTWRELAPPAYPQSDGDGESGGESGGEGDKDGEDKEPEGPSLTLVWTLVPGGADEPGVLWAGTIPGGLFRSDDKAETWALVDTLWDEPARAKWMGGGYDEPGIHSVLVDPRDAGNIAIGVSSGGVWRSGDGARTWRQAGQGLRAEYMPPDQAFDPAVQDPHRLAQCPAAPDVIWCQHHNGIFLSRDGGDTFTEIETAKPSHFGFAVAVHPDDADTAWFVPAVKDECRVPVDEKLVVSRTTDGGKTFEVFSDGLPEAPAFDLVYRHGLAVDGSGTRLAMGSTTGGLWVGAGGGETWICVADRLPPVNQVAWGV